MKPFFVKATEDIPKNYTGVVELANGNRLWLVDGFYHREDGPAIEHIKGYKQWWISGHFIADSNNFTRFKDNCIVVERGIPTDMKFGKLKLTEAKLLTTKGTMFICDNLPGLDIDI